MEFLIMSSSKNSTEMSDLTSLVLPTTRAVLWFPKPDLDANSPHYRSIDYLCDGILTSSLTSLKERTSLVLIGKNFGSNLMIFVARTLVKKELESFLNLIPKEDTGEILVVDDGNLMDELKSLVPAKNYSQMKRVN